MVNFKFEYKKRGSNIIWKLLPDDAGGIALTGNIEEFEDFIKDAIFTSVATFFEGRKK